MAVLAAPLPAALDSAAVVYDLTRFNKIAIQGTPQMAVD